MILFLHGNQSTFDKELEKFLIVQNLWLLFLNIFMIDVRIKKWKQFYQILFQVI